MAFTVKCGSNMKRAREGYGMGLVRNSSFGRKRVALSEICTEFRDDDDCFSTSKRQCFQDSFLSTDKSALENLPQEILIRILCGVEHDDLKRLFFVSNPIREVVSFDFVKETFNINLHSLNYMLSFETHLDYFPFRKTDFDSKTVTFAYSTPRKTVGFRNMKTSGDFNEVEAPNAPKQSRVPRFRLSKKKFEDISVTLFPSGYEDGFAQRELFMGIELAM